KKHTFRGQELGERVADFLNHPLLKRKTVSARRVHQLVDDLGKLEQYFAGKPIWKPGYEWDFVPNVERRWNRLNRHLARYRCIPMLTLEPERIPDYQDESTKAYYVVSYEVITPGVYPAEWNFVRDLLEICMQGQFSKLRQCRNCSSWLFAKFPHQV